MWAELRQNIESIRLENKIPESDFRPVNINSWQNIQEKIISTFCVIENYKERFNWLWSDFKLETYAVQFNRNWPFDAFLQLIDDSEYVWLFINESVNEGTKFWFYEGRIESIVFILEESFVDEVYIASKKYDWLLCLNHHDILFATGVGMPDKLKELEERKLLKID